MLRDEPGVFAVLVVANTAMGLVQLAEPVLSAGSSTPWAAAGRCSG